MNEVKQPKKPLIFYYGVVLLILMLFNLLAMPWLAQRQVLQVDYSTFIQMAEEQNLGLVEVQETENQILFTDKEETAIYKTGMMPDPDLTRRLEESGAKSPAKLSSRPTRFSASFSAGYCPSSYLSASASTCLRR